MYSVFYTHSASKDWKSIPSVLIPPLKRAIEELQTNPRPVQSKKLMTMKYSYRLRKGDYRILYTVDDAERTVVVYKIAHRHESYR